MRQAFRAFLIVQSVKHLPAVQETLVRFLGQEDPLEKEIATQSSILAWRIPWTAWWATVHGVAKTWTRLSDFTFTSFHHYNRNPKEEAYII